ncbi:MAG: carbamoyltransferase [Proteobacteria bacterium]|nr:carbamoyltransferase [Pseudomonadota bacterium]MBU1688300.1 carbamoyltransferase [Pseudomonadota bacterium]
MGAILGISAYYHDSAAVLLIDGKICAAAHEERFTRKKHDPSFPVNAVRYVLEEGGVLIADLEAIAFYDKPFLKFERLLETYHAFAPSGLKSFLSAMPVWIKEKMFMRKLIWDELEEINGGRLLHRPQLLFPEHHLSHGASAYFPSPFDEAAILTIDGVGEWATTTIGHGKGNTIAVLRELTFPHSIGLLYSALTYYCGFKVNSGEYKLMGLAPYGNHGGERVARFREVILRELVDLRDDGSLLLNMTCFNFATGLTMCKEERWLELFGIPKRAPEGDLGQAYMDLALAVQQVTEESVLRLARTARELTGAKNLVMAGGVALNCVANGKLLRSNIFEKLWIQPAAGDAGGALGAALAAYHIWQEAPRLAEAEDLMGGTYLGPAYSDIDIERVCRKYQAKASRLDEHDLFETVARLLADGMIVGWFQGRMEYGPRALGNRSILGDPRRPEMQKKLNLKIKYREGFRPFAPSVLAEECAEYFDLPGGHSPYMLLIDMVREDHRYSLPEGYEEKEMYERLYHQRSDIPAVTHVDYTARIHTVSQRTNPRYWQLINAFKGLTGCGLVVNTSFNVRGEPIVCTPEDAYRCFMRTEMDWLVINNFLFEKKDQPEWMEKDNWQESFVLD